jgi:hypothetical protein
MTCRGCRTVNGPRKRKCEACGKALPRKRQPKHREALKLDRQVFVAANGGSEACGICGTAQKEGGRRLHRDHDHRTGRPRGILCFPCNGALRPYMTVEWLRAAVAYMERAAAV